MVNLLRLVIILVFFVMGIIVGNVYLPQRNFDQKNIVVPQKPKVSFDINSIPPVETILKNAEKYKNILIEISKDQEEIIGFENDFKRTILQLYYKETATNYALELLKLQIQPENITPYIKARDEYKKSIALIESVYPLEVPKEVLVIKEENKAIIPSTLTLQNIGNLAVSTETVKTVSSDTVPVISSNTVKTVSSTTVKTN